MNNYTSSYFDEYVNRENTTSCKYDYACKNFKNNDVISLSVADMDFKAPIEAINAINSIVSKGIYGYSYCPDDYYCIVAKWLNDKYYMNISKSDIVFCPRIVQAISIIIQNFTSLNDEIILFAPGYSPLNSVIEYNNRKVVNVPLTYANNSYTLDISLLKSLITPKTKAIILINPHNPTGKVWTKSELSEICGICVERNILIISDEIHADFIRPNYTFTSVASLSENISLNSIVCTSPAKTFNLPGLHISNIIIKNSYLRDKFIDGINKNMLMDPNCFVYPVVSAVLSSPSNYIESLNNYIEYNFQYVNDIFKKHMPEFKVVHSQGTYLMWIDYTETALTETDILNWSRNSNVDFYLGSNFGDYGKGFIRLNIATQLSRLKTSMNRLIENYPLKI